MSKLCLIWHSFLRLMLTEIASGDHDELDALKFSKHPQLSSPPKRTYRSMVPLPSPHSLPYLTLCLATCVTNCTAFGHQFPKRVESTQVQLYLAQRPAAQCPHRIVHSTLLFPFPQITSAQTLLIYTTWRNPVSH